MTPYVEPGASWRRFWGIAGTTAVVVALAAAVPGPDLPAVGWVVVIGAVLGLVLLGTVSARRAWTVRVDEDGLSVGRERIPLREIDAGHLDRGSGGADAGAPVLGGGWAVPEGRTGLPLRRTDGATVLVPTRDPAALRSAVLGWRGTLGP